MHANTSPVSGLDAPREPPLRMVRFLATRGLQNHTFHNIHNPQRDIAPVLAPGAFFDFPISPWNFSITNYVTSVGFWHASTLPQDSDVWKPGDLRVSDSPVYW